MRGQAAAVVGLTSMMLALPAMSLAHAAPSVPTTGSGALVGALPVDASIASMSNESFPPAPKSFDDVQFHERHRTERAADQAHCALSDRHR